MKSFLQKIVYIILIFKSPRNNLTLLMFNIKKYSGLYKILIFSKMPDLICCNKWTTPKRSQIWTRVLWIVFGRHHWEHFGKSFCPLECFWAILKDMFRVYLPAHLFSLFFFFLIFFFYFWLCWVFVAARGLSLAVASGCYSLLWCAGFSLRWLLLLQSTGSRCAGFSSCGSRALERRLSSCVARA